MPTVSLNRNDVMKRMGEELTDDEFETLCFDFGIELDEVTSEKELVEREKGSEAAEGLSDEKIFKIDVPANRYDLLCLEGICRALKIFLGEEQLPKFRVIRPAADKIIRIVQKAQTKGVREYVVGAVLRNVQLDATRYASLLDIQEKMHQNIGRLRTLVAIGTHNLDSLSPPFSYEANPQADIKFVPLMESKEFALDKLLHYYKHEKAQCHLAPFVHLTENEPLHPVIYDSSRVVLSVPPLVNGEHSKMSPDTKNILIECTGTDWTKLNITLNMLVTMFSAYCAEPYTIEQVEVVDEAKGVTHLLPDLTATEFTVDTSYINRGIGVSLGGEQMATILKKMQLPTHYDAKTEQLRVHCPATRPDILHAVDIMEDVAIAYGYNNIKKTQPKCMTVGGAQPLNKLTDYVREELAESGFSEVLTWVLCSHNDNFKSLNRKDDGQTAVVLKNPKTRDFEVVRSQLLSGLLSVLSENRGKISMPVRIFEAGDVVVLDSKRDVGARNERHVAALFSGTSSSGFEGIHGLLDRVMLKNNCVRPDVEVKDAPTKDKPGCKHYTLVPSDNPSYFPGRRADVLLEGQLIGHLGIIHPEVLAAFNITTPCSALELFIEPFL